MQTEIIFSGFGGQGVLFAGQLLSYAAMDNDLEVTWIPSYGPEMRGGTANCTVVIADEEIGSPLVRHPNAAVAMNLPSLDKYESVIKPGGVLVVNSSMINRPVNRTDIVVVMVPANEIAERLGDKRMTNMVLMGALLANLKVLPLEALEKALQEHLPARHHRFLPLNYQALREGAQIPAQPAKA
ncbi:MAG TPA: 2-oxoacid:acceptor oxidoreductase family protein [Anaerolineaceae bacterium]|jgi:2-oxoglutarate ferredoxin oxidoreductase subunit gamma|nr:2-oxoacid:acceptor oxidoreductase family protein [Longilinea sp.]HQF62749.1 2-oxoacid:acceptor oxidoreductase family protein [Anaerolineaceae bacterium]HQH85811.1 2-oxoacid:acceptor oxidoreductase family protein [Anaerolineaceae bacterium]HQN44056.1 2-oxoacid:acceptor oxidoreductase family protein [Anaerolineaceae bacterium]